MSTETEQTAVTDGEQRIPLDEAGEVTLPVVEVLTGRAFLTGKSGAGKSNSASVVVEELLDRGFPVLIVDTDGEYWGLKEDYEILHVGADEECDLQVGPEHAEKLAELALEQSVPIILDVSGYLDEEDASALVRKTASALFSKEKKLNRPFLMLVEEIHEFLPEGGGQDETARMLTRVAKRGRKRGLGICGMSQRPADVKKDFITQCDWLLWHRLTWENDTKVVRRVIDAEHADAVQDLDDGEAFLMADFLDEDVQRVQVRRKHTFDAGATPDLGEFERPELKSVGGDLVSELEAISEREERRQDRIAQLEAELEEKEERIEDLEDELESARDMRDLAQQMAEGLQTSGGDTGAAQEKVDELIEERNTLRSKLEAREERIDELEAEMAELRDELADRPELDERALEAVEVLADEFGVGEAGDGKWKRKYEQARERIEELEEKRTAELDTDVLENTKVRSVVSEFKQRLADLSDTKQQMLRYYMIEGPAKATKAYKYAGNSPSSSRRKQYSNELADAGFIEKADGERYDYALRENVADRLGDGFTEDEIDTVFRELDEHVRETLIQQEAGA